MSEWETGKYGEVDKKQSIQKKHWLSLFPTMGQLVGTPCLHSQKGCRGVVTVTVDVCQGEC